MNRHWGKWIRARLSHRGVKIIDVARELRVDRTTITRWLDHAELPSPARPHSEDLARILGVPSSIVHFGWEEMPPTEPGPSPELVEWEELTRCTRLAKERAIVMAGSQALSEDQQRREILGITQTIGGEALKILHAEAALALQIWTKMRRETGIETAKKAAASAQKKPLTPSKAQRVKPGERPEDGGE